MPLISYAQNYEDVMLWRALKHVEHGFYIDAGAAWPVEHSVTKLFFDAGWSGINIEPNHDLIKLYRTHRPNDINLEVALSDSPGSQLMGFIDKTGLSSLDMSLIEEHTDQGYSVQKTSVEVTTLLCVCQRYAANRAIHFLKVDVEGYERHVLLGNDWSIVRPWVVVVEATHPMQQLESYHEWESILLDANYHFVYADGLNRFYVAEERPELFNAFKYPPNVFDQFLLPDQIKLQEVNADFFILKEHLSAVKISISWRITLPLRLIKKWFFLDARRAIASAKIRTKQRIQQAGRIFLSLCTFYPSAFPKLQMRFLTLFSRHQKVAQTILVINDQTLTCPFIPTKLTDLSLEARDVYHILLNEITPIKASEQA